MQSVPNHNSGVMVSMLALSFVDLGFEPRSGQNKNCKIDICCFSAKAKKKNMCVYGHPTYPNFC